MARILIVVYRELDEEQVYWALGQYVGSQAKGAGSGTGRGNPRGGKSKSRLGKALLQQTGHHGPIAIHLGNGTTDESHVPSFLFPELV